MALKLSEVFDHWEIIRQELIEGVKKLTNEQLDWKPEGGKSSIGALLRHIAETENFWYGRVVLGNEYRDIEKDDAPDIVSIMGELEKSHRAVLNILDKNTIEEWQQKTYTYKWDEGEETFTLKWITWHLIEHEMRHRGQIFMLMRLQGLVPPNV